jgi:hypothetical protein
MNRAASPGGTLGALYFWAMSCQHNLQSHPIEG